MKAIGLTRKQFLRTSSLALASTALLPDLLLAEGNRSASKPQLDAQHPSDSSYTIKNVLLETAFDYDSDGKVVATKTALCSVQIESGKIKSIGANVNDADARDAKGRLMLPSFRDMHIHLDKTFYGDKWQATRRGQGGVKGMIALEQQMLPELLKNSTYKAEKLIELLQSNGTAFARSHVNIEPTSKLDSLHHLQLALENKKNSFGAELVAFPQHGVYYTDTIPYLKEAAKTNIDFIGGLDPFTIDGAIEKTIDFTVQLALDHNKGIDIHLHESGESGRKTVEYLIKKVHENPILQGKTYLSHCFVLAKLDKIQQQAIAEQLSAAQIGIVSTIPFGGLVMPIPTLMENQVKVLTGNDSIVDHWNTFGTGSVLQKANLAAQIYGQVTEYELSRILTLATAGILPLDNKGRQQWPKAGDEANFVLLEASCSAEAVSRISPVRSLIYQGHWVF